MKKWCPTYTIDVCNCYSVEADDKSFIGMADSEFEDILTKSNEMLAISVFEVVRLLYDFTEYPEEVMIRLINSINNKAVIVYDWEKANYQDADTDSLVELVKKLKKCREKSLEDYYVKDLNIESSTLYDDIRIDAEQMVRNKEGRPLAYWYAPASYKSEEYCSNCHERTRSEGDDGEKYCINCGAEMIDEQSYRRMHDRGLC